MQLTPQNPALGFVLGFASHLVADSLPHWDYQPGSLNKKDPKRPLDRDMKIGKQFFKDLVVIAGDALLGVILSVAIFSFLLFHTALWVVVLGACAGILPDPLQFVYFKTRSKILEPLQRFHVWIQKGKSLYIQPRFGIGLQAALVVCILAIEKLLI